jgi:hypothetical protein
MPTVYKVLGQAAPANTSNANLYTVPASTSAIVSTLVIANTTATINITGVTVSNVYYFTNYANSLKQANQAVVEYKNRKGDVSSISGAIVRFAVFLGKINVPTELPTNDEEQEEIFKNHDSVFLSGLSKLDGPVWVLTNYEQQTPISYMRVR